MSAQQPEMNYDNWESGPHLAMATGLNRHIKTVPCNHIPPKDCGFEHFAPDGGDSFVTFIQYEPGSWLEPDIEVSVSQEEQNVLRAIFRRARKQWKGIAVEQTKE